MRRLIVVLVFLALAGSLSAQSVTISESKLDELVAILESYGAISVELRTSLDGLTTRTSDLETGFNRYEQTVNDELIPKAKLLERQVFWLKIGLIVLVPISVYGVLK